MSVITNLILSFSSLENEAERLRDVNSFAYNDKGINFVSIDYNKDREAGTVWYGGNKFLSGNVFIAVYNHFDTADFVRHLYRILWKEPQLIQLFVKEESDEKFNLVELVGYKDEKDDMRRDTILIENDTEVKIARVKQLLTYDGLSESIPQKLRNQVIIQRVKEDAKQFTGLNAIYLLEPGRTFMDDFLGSPSRGLPERLSRVVCTVEVRSQIVMTGALNAYSALVLIWFQGDFMLPIVPEILDRIKLIPFSELCEEVKV